jgi:hypothetical protein
MNCASLHLKRERPAGGFTLIEVALTIGLVAGAALVAIVLIGNMHDSVRKLKAPEARPRIIADSQPQQNEHPLPDEKPEDADKVAEEAKSAPETDVPK